MSKETFSQKISESMNKKMEAIESLDLKTLLEKDEYFQVAICLSYMSLSKEKIIDKDIKNNDRLGRLTQKVDNSEINKVFQPGFAKDMPKIMYARENNNLWILDNIRDSIMHGACDIDETRNCFIINNTQYNRELNAEVPFSWFIAYAKNDILTKKISDNHTMNSYYYNKEKKKRSNFETDKEIINNILYKVNINGNKFNVSEIENRIKELFMLYSETEIKDEDIEKYKEKIAKEKIRYNERYLVSFYLAKEKVIETIKKEFPGIKVKIQINNRKHKLANKISKKLPQNFNSYDQMFNMLNNEVSPKGISLLRIISNICENFDSDKTVEELNQLENNDWKKNTELLHKMITSENLSHNKKNNLSLTLNQDLNTLRSILLNVYGLSTLVINHETLYNQHFLNSNPSEFEIYAIHKRPYLEYANKCKSTIMKLLEIEISLFSKQDQLNKCTNETAKKKIQSNINDLNLKLETLKEDLNTLSSTIGFDPVVKQNEVNHKVKEFISKGFEKYYDHFEKAKTVESKKKIRKIIGTLIDAQIEEESKYTYSYCNNMQDVLTIIRNCFSHIGRISTRKNDGVDTRIVLNDYDTNGEKSAEVTCRYIDLIELLKNPYQETKDKTK